MEVTESSICHGSGQNDVWLFSGKLHPVVKQVMTDVT
jgi:hypothetical protein